MTGVGSVAELEGNLAEDNVLVPIELSMSTSINVTIDSFAGCFIRGAGTCTMYTSNHVNRAAQNM